MPMANGRSIPINPQPTNMAHSVCCAMLSDSNPHNDPSAKRAESHQDQKGAAIRT
jgi:hypothetical protein